MEQLPSWRNNDVRDTPLQTVHEGEPSSTLAVSGGRNADVFGGVPDKGHHPVPKVRNDHLPRRAWGCQSSIITDELYIVVLNQEVQPIVRFAFVRNVPYFTASVAIEATRAQCSLDQLPRG